MASDEINQKAFDTAARHLLTQGIKSIENDMCSYRTSDGRYKCAVGALIEDANYNPNLERHIANFPIVYAAVARSGYDGVNVDLLVALQDVHDRSSEDDWREELYDLADRFCLDSSVLSAV